MRDQRISRYLLRSSEQVANQTERAREIAKRSVELLQESAPDTFLGRKTHDPFPSETQPPLPNPREP
jgi:hypothetical protein